MKIKLQEIAVANKRYEVSFVNLLSDYIATATATAFVFLRGKEIELHSLKINDAHPASLHSFKLHKKEPE